METQTLAVRNQNPGNLRDSSGGFQKFSDPTEGKAALYNDLTAKMTGKSKTGLTGDSSLLEFAKTYAPASDKNDPVQYAADIANKMGISPDTKIGTLSSRIDDFASAVSSNEDSSHKYKATNQPVKSNQAFNPTPYSNPTNGNTKPDNSIENLPNNPQPVDTLGSQLANRGQEANQAINSIVGGEKTGSSRLSGVLQLGGALAGGLGDVINKGLELIPGVKQVENLIGQRVGKLAQTDVGQAVMKTIKEQSDAHPELAKDIGAGFNILTAIPILRGLGVVGKIGLDAGSQALKDVVVKGFAKDLETSGGKIAQKVFTPEVVDTSIKYGVAPEIKSEAGKTITDTASAQTILEKEVSRIEDEVYGPALIGVDLKFPMEGVKNLANDISVENLSDPSAVNKILDRVAAKYGDTPTLEQLNQAKRDITKKISDAGFADPDLSNNRIARMALQQATEKAGLQFGAGDLGAINKQMGDILKTLDFYEKIDGMSIKQGLLHKGIKAISTATGAGIGGMFGNPVAGGALGYGASDLIEGQLGKLTPRSIRAGIIKRTGANAVKVSKSEMLKKLPGLFGGAVNVK